MTSNNIKQAVRAIMADNPGMKYTEALRTYEASQAFDVQVSVRGRIPADAIEIGHTPDGETVNIRLSRGVFVCGTTGSGKTVAVANIAREADSLGYEVTTLCQVHPGEIDMYVGKNLPSIDPASNLSEIASTLEDYTRDEGKKKRLLIVEEINHLVFDNDFDTERETNARRRIGVLLSFLAESCPDTAVIMTSQRDDHRFRSQTHSLRNRIAFGRMPYGDLPVAMMPESLRVDSGDPKGTAILASPDGTAKVRIKAPVTLR